MPPRVLGVLELLLARAGDVVSRPEIIDAVWKEAFVTDTSLAEAVSFLRQALGDDPQSPTYIRSSPRVPVRRSGRRNPGAAARSYRDSGRSGTSRDGQALDPE